MLVTILPRPQALAPGLCNLYAVRILKTHGLPTSSLHEVTRATVLARVLYSASARSGFATAQDCSRFDRFINRTVNLHVGFINRTVNLRPTVILSTLWLTRQKIGCSPPLFATHTTFSASSSPYPHQTAWPPQASSSIYRIPLKYDKECIPRVLYRALLPPVQS